MWVVWIDFTQRQTKKVVEHLFGHVIDGWQFWLPLLGGLTAYKMFFKHFADYYVHSSFHV